MTTTHTVFNQVPVLQDYNLFTTDIALHDAVVREGAGWHGTALSRYGAQLGGAETIRLGELANRHGPELVTHDRNGRRVDRVDFHPAWFALLEMLYAAGVHCSAWAEPRAGAQVARAAAFFLQGQIEAGSLCPATMTFASIPVLAKEPDMFTGLRDKLFSRDFDARDMPLDAKHSAMIGMGMTEKQGGSDVRSNTTTAQPCGCGGRGGEYTLVGHKWFFSAPMCDAHLVLAREGEDLSCFFVPRWLPDGTRNNVHIQRLKDKVGNRSNASSEVEFNDAYGILIGEPGRGVATIIEMASHTRLDCVLGSAALMRQALVQAIHHARHRSAFGALLIEQPLMRSVLSDLALECEAATVLAVRLARACEESGNDPLERALWRIVTPAAKFWICKRAIEVAAECMEVWGGNGYVEDGPMGRLFREAPVNSIWEGSGNVMCLDVLRAFAREPHSADALKQFLVAACSDHPILSLATRELVVQLEASHAQESSARYIAQQLVL
ncbi:MAG TPA: isovaleryl-CoA dehydrogenase, partial [Rhodocyclaceae bacterium]|nr:isovaleryl-CoA dehydrogenase [Rhodocyclaceae bacterium]